MKHWINYLTGQTARSVSAPTAVDGWVVLHGSTLDQRRQWLAKRRELRAQHRQQRPRRVSRPVLFHPRYGRRMFPGLPQDVVPVAAPAVEVAVAPATTGASGLGFWPFGDSEADIRKKAEDAVFKLQLLGDEITTYMGANRDNDAVAKQGATYIKGLQQTIAQTNPDTVAKNFLAGGVYKDNAYALIDAAGRVFSSIDEMFHADMNDPSGVAGQQIAQKRLTASQAELLTLDNKSAFWEGGGFGASTLSFFENLQKYAKWFLIGGAVLLAAPVVMPLVGRAIGGYKSGHAQGSAASIKANRRRRR